MRPPKRFLRNAFTLIELLVVLVVLAVIAVIVIPRFANHGLRGKEAALRGNLKELRYAVTRFQTDTGYYPAQLPDLIATAAPASGLDGDGTACALSVSAWRGPYMAGPIASDLVTGTQFTYSIVAPSVGNVTSTAPGTGSNGIPYSQS